MSPTVWFGAAGNLLMSGPAIEPVGALEAAAIVAASTLVAAGAVFAPTLEERVGFSVTLGAMLALVLMWLATIILCAV